jgi:hypothetical protein
VSTPACWQITPERLDRNLRLKGAMNASSVGAVLAPGRQMHGANLYRYTAQQFYILTQTRRSRSLQEQVSCLSMSETDA